jgi:hypothetical protein
MYVNVRFFSFTTNNEFEMTIEPIGCPSNETIYGASTLSRSYSITYVFEFVYENVPCKWNDHTRFSVTLLGFDERRDHETVPSVMETIYF